MERIRQEDLDWCRSLTPFGGPTTYDNWPPPLTWWQRSGREWVSVIIGGIIWSIPGMIVGATIMGILWWRLG